MSCGLVFCFPALVNIFNQMLLVFQTSLKMLAHLPGLIVFGRIPGFIAIILTVLSLIWLEQPLVNKKWGKYLLIIYAGCFILIHFPLNGEVTFVDVGQGDCAIIRRPLNQQVLMIDTGGHLNFKQAVWQKRAASNKTALNSVNYLKSRGISKIDAVLVSHHDADHCGYLSDILDNIKVDNILLPSGMEKQNLARNWESRGHQATVPVLNKNQLAYPLAVIHPFKAGHGENKDSMVLFGRFGGQSFLFMGDLDRHGELQILQQYPGLNSDIIKLGHHGSKTASDPEFLKRIHPRLAIISAGRHNRYGHPNSETIASLKRQSIPYLSTQDKGMISYIYWGNKGYWQTKITGDELRWTLQH